MFAIEEPEPGFSPSLMGAMGLFAITAAGLMKTIYIAKDTRLDITPQDIGIKGLCYYTYKTANLYRTKTKLDSTPVYIISSCTHSELTFPQYIKLMEDFDFWAEAAFEKNFLIPSLHCTDNRFVFKFLVIAIQIFQLWILVIYKNNFRFSLNIFYRLYWVILLLH